MPSAARALKIENAWSASELKMRNRQLAKAEQEIMYALGMAYPCISKLKQCYKVFISWCCRIKDAEIAELRRQATSTDDQLRYTKSELIEYRQILQKKDDLLKQTYESLVGSARERSKLREELILVEKVREMKHRTVWRFHSHKNLNYLLAHSLFNALQCISYLDNTLETQFLLMTACQDLMDARDALHGWTTKLVDLKSVIESADEDDEGIDLDDKDLIEDGKKNQKYELFKAMKDSEEESSTSPEMTTAVDLLKDLQDLSEQLLADVQDDENTLSIMDD